MSHSPRLETNISDRDRPSSLHSLDFEWWGAPIYERNSSTSDPSKFGTAFTSTAGALVQGSCIGSPEPLNHLSSLSSHHGPGSSVSWAPWDGMMDWPSATLALEAPSQTTKGWLDTEPISIFDTNNGFNMEKTSLCNPLGIASLGSWLQQDVHASGLSTAGTSLMSTLPTVAVDPLLAHRVTADGSSFLAYSVVGSLESQGTHLNTDANGQSSLVPASHKVKPDDASSTMATWSNTTNADADVRVCPHCSVQFTGRFRNGNICRHLRLQHNAASYPSSCPDCEIVFDRTDALSKHVCKHHPDTAHTLLPVQHRRYSAGMDRNTELGPLEESFHSAVESRLDTISVNAESPSTGHSAQETSTSPAPKGNEGVHCPICQQVFRRLPDLRRHVNGKHDRKKHFCPICSMSFARKVKCIEHVRRQHGSTSYPEGQLDRHRHPRLEDAIKLPRIQEAPDMYLCTEHGCFKIFDSNAERLRHQRTHISKDERSFKCEECALSFLCPKDLERHANTHKDDDDETKPTIH